MRTRLLSLDALRGATIAAMFLVNNAGDWEHVYAPLRHAEWNGCTPADLVFPFFLFIMGVAMALGQRPSLGKVTRRTLLLSFFNVILAGFSWGAFLGHFRFYGVLQRIAFCYLLASFVAFRTGALAQAAICAVLLALYAALLRLGGNLERFSNIVDRLDSKLMLSWLYEIDSKLGLGHDPEGLLSTLGALATTLSGILCGTWLRREDRSPSAKLAALALAGTALLAGGMLWSRSLPLNKNLWTPSYVLFTSGWAGLALSLCSWLIDVKGHRAWAQPLIVYGSNAIAAYVGVGIVSYTLVWIHISPGLRVKTFLYQHLYQSWLPWLLGDQACSAAWGLSYIALSWLVLWALYRKRVFLKV